LRAIVPRTNSSTIDASTKIENVYAITPIRDEPAPAASKPIPPATATPSGQRNVRPSARSDARRQATSGPMPIKSRSGSPKVCRKKL
jgi:hypothetical protein